MYIKLLENRELSVIWNRVIFQSLLTVCMLNLYVRQRTSNFNVKLFCKSLITSNQCLSMCLSEISIVNTCIACCPTVLSTIRSKLSTTPWHTLWRYLSLHVLWSIGLLLNAISLKVIFTLAFRPLLIFKVTTFNLVKYWPVKRHQFIAFVYPKNSTALLLKFYVYKFTIFHWSEILHSNYKVIA